MEDAGREAHAETARLVARSGEGIEPHGIGHVVRSAAELYRARATLKTSGAPFIELGEKIGNDAGRHSSSAMHLAKGLELSAVAVSSALVRGKGDGLTRLRRAGYRFHKQSTPR